jgi:hypothetical protein
MSDMEEYRQTWEIYKLHFNTNPKANEHKRV